MKSYLYNLATDRVNDPLAQIVKFFLWVFSCFYAMVVCLLLFLYNCRVLKRCGLGRPVVSVGNITLGGTGKTPLVHLIAEFYKGRDLKPVILTRGYMNKKHKDPQLSYQVLDEPILLRESLEVPVMVGRDRVSNARRALQDHNPDIFIMDDGFQHWKVLRDLDIVVIDTTRPFGNGRLIPRGILREPLSSLKRAQVFVLTKTDMGRNNVSFIREKLTRINPEALVVESVHQPAGLIDFRTNQLQTNLAVVQKKTVGAFCSIGDPESFRHSLLSLGAKVKTVFTFIDHHVYSEKDVKNIVNYCKSNKIATLVTTQKDTVKLRKYRSLFDEALKVFSLKIILKLTQGKDEFFDRISRLSVR